MKGKISHMGELAADVDPNLAAHGTPAIAEGIVLGKVKPTIPIQGGIE